MKKIYAILASVFAAAVLFTSCNPRDFGDINKSPNSPSTAYTNYLFTNAQRYLYYFVTGNATNAYDPWQQEWNGYLAEIKNNQYGPLGTTTSYSAVNTMYLYPLKNLHYIIQMNEDPEQKDLPNVAALGTSANQIAAAKTLMGFYFMTLSDVVGPIVITEAFQGATEDNWKPKYNTQKEVYTIVDETLTAAYDQFDEAGTLSAAADANFGGSIAKWKKFNATVRMLMAIKLCDVDPATGKERFARAYAQGGMKNVSDGLFHTHDDLNWNMLYYWCNPTYASAGFGMAPNMYIVEQMKAFKDNRMFKYFDIEGYKGERDPETFPRDQYSSFYGVPFGLESNTDVTAWADCCASINSSMLAMDASLPVITAARSLFVEAEAAFRGWISADPKALYEAGIKSSFEQWGATGADAYIASAEVAYDAAKGLEQIAIQRWIAGYLSDGVEAWSDWRRLDIPKMYVGPAAKLQGNNHYPYRLAFYSGHDPELNAENYAEAIKDLSGGEDNVNNRLWWDVADNEEGVLTAEQCKPTVQKPAKWEVFQTGTYKYNVSYTGNPFADIKTTIYEDVNHPGEYKISPWGQDGKYELLLKMDANGEFVVENQIVGVTADGDPINVADYNIDQKPEPLNTEVCYFDTDDGCWYFYLIYRYGGPRGGGSKGFLCYGNDAFIPDAQ